MKYSIRRQITAIFIGLLVFILGGVLVINTGFLGGHTVKWTAYLWKAN